MLDYPLIKFVICFKGETMTGLIKFVPKDEFTFNTYNFEMGIQYFDYEISISIDKPSMNLDFGNTDLNSSIKEMIEACDDEEIILFYEKCLGQEEALLKNASYISFDFDIETSAFLYGANPSLRGKKILFTDTFDLSVETVKKIESLFADTTDNIYFDVQGNTQLITFEEYKKTVEAINLMISDVEKFNYSPLEKIMYVYDLVRKKIYTCEKSDEDVRTSRDLSQVLLGDKIVCLGYTRLFRTLLEKLGINSKEIILLKKGEVTGHARNEIYIKDEKYGVDGVYYFDPTWDSKRNNNDTSYLSSYRFFAMTRLQMDALDEGKYLVQNCPYFSSDIAQKFEEEVKERGLAGISKKLSRVINYMSYTIYDKQLLYNPMLLEILPKSMIPSPETVQRKLSSLMKKFNTPIKAPTFLEALYNVRKNEYYIAPEDYPLNINEIFKIIQISKWDFSNNDFDKMLMELLTKQEQAMVNAKKLQKFSNETDLEKNIEQIRLTRTLRKILDNKKFQ